MVHVESSLNPILGEIFKMARKSLKTGMDKYDRLAFLSTALILIFWISFQALGYTLETYEIKSVFGAWEIAMVTLSSFYLLFFYPFKLVFGGEE